LVLFFVEAEKEEEKKEKGAVGLSGKKGNESTRGLHHCRTLQWTVVSRSARSYQFRKEKGKDASFARPKSLRTATHPVERINI